VAGLLLASGGLVLVPGASAATVAPTLARSVVVAPVKGHAGHVFVKLPRSAVFVPLTRRRVIAVGSTVDTTGGSVAMTAASSGGGGLQKGTFDGGAFVVTQARTGLTNLVLTQGRRPILCLNKSGDRASAARRSRLQRLLHAHVHGRFSTTGKYAAATVRGTEWTTADTCSETIISDRQGNVDTKANGANLERQLAPGEAAQYRCSRRGMPPVSSRYCVAFLSLVTTLTINGQPKRVAAFATGLSTKSPDESNQLCIKPPKGKQTCTGYPLAPPDQFGFRNSIVGCTPNQGPGAYTISWRLGGVTLGAPLIYHAPTGSTIPGPCSAWLGQPSVGPHAAALDANVKRVNRYTLPTGATSPWLYAYLGPLGKTGQEQIRGIVYADSQGAPGTLLGVTSEITITPSSSIGWYQLSFAPYLRLRPGAYWIGLLTGGQAGLAGVAYFSVPGSSRSNANDYALGPSNPFGPLGSNGEIQMSLYLFYSASG
jgi:hypothetical protein